MDNKFEESSSENPLVIYAAGKGKGF